MKRVLLFFLFLSQTVIFSQTLKFDTVAAMQVGPGMYYYKVVEASKPWVIYVFKADLKNKNTKIESVKAKDKIMAFENPQAAMRRKSGVNYRAIAGINADFYNTANGQPIGFDVNKGQVITRPCGLSAIAFDNQNNPFIGRFSLDIGKISNGKSSFVFSNINGTRGTDQLVLFNRFKDTTTGANAYGSEVLLRPINGWTLNDSNKCIVEKIENNVGNMIIKDGCYVISGHGKAQTWLMNNLKVGDTLKLFTLISGLKKPINEVAGAYPRIVKDGVNYGLQGAAEEGGPDHAPDYHPRSAAGTSKDSTWLYLVAVDGRSNASRGMNLTELADYMIKAGAYQAVNFDGGGSTCMVINDSVMNVPSDGALRNVANSLVVFSTLEPTNTLNTVYLKEKYLSMFKGDTYKLQLQGSDINGYPVCVDNSKVNYSCKPQTLGKIESGIFTAGNASLKGCIYATYQGKTDSIRIKVKVINRITLLPKSVVTDLQKNVTFKQSAYDGDGIVKYYNNDQFAWSLSDESVASIDNTGILKAKKEGSVKVYIKMDLGVDSSIVTVKNIDGTNTIDKLNDTLGWKISSENIDTAKIFVSKNLNNSNTIGIYYSFIGKASTNQNIYLEKDINILGAPDSLIVDAISDGKKHHLNYFITDDNGESFRINVLKYLDKSVWDFQNVSFKSVSPLAGGNFYYPVTFKKIMLEMMYSGKVAGTRYNGNLYFKNLRVVYPKSVGIEKESNICPKNYALCQNYPNPFNPTTTIKYSIPEASYVNLSVYNTLGEKVADLVNEYQGNGTYNATFNASNLSSGVYFYKLSTKGTNKPFVEVRKMMLLK